jgi:hypothetical protein
MASLSLTKSHKSLTKLGRLSLINKHGRKNKRIDLDIDLYQSYTIKNGFTIQRFEIQINHVNGNVCRFSISGVIDELHYPNPGFAPGKAYDFGISVDDDNIFKLKGCGLSTILIYAMVQEIKSFTDPSQKFYIDTDSSQGFWDRIGMVETNNNNAEGNGWHKNITFQALEKYANNNIHKSPIIDFNPDLVQYEDYPEHMSQSQNVKSKMSKCIFTERPKTHITRRSSRIRNRIRNRTVFKKQHNSTNGKTRKSHKRKVKFQSIN